VTIYYLEGSLNPFLGWTFFQENEESLWLSAWFLVKPQPCSALKQWSMIRLTENHQNPHSGYPGYVPALLVSRGVMGMLFPPLFLWLSFPSAIWDPYTVALKKKSRENMEWIHKKVKFFWKWARHFRSETGHLRHSCIYISLWLLGKIHCNFFGNNHRALRCHCNETRPWEQASLILSELSVWNQ